jgi:hypothetical protein
LPELPGADAVAAVARASGDLPSLPGSRKRLVVAFDATASRDASWAEAVPMMDMLLATLPDQLEVALGVHGGGKVKVKPNKFTTNIGKLRDQAAGIQCASGFTRLLDILAEAQQADCVLYVGDCYEEGNPAKIADKLGRRGCRVIVLQEGDDESARGVFAEIAERTGGALLPFNSGSLAEVRGLLQAIAVLAVEGREALEEKQEAMPAAALLLEHLDPARLLIGHAKRVER